MNAVFRRELAAYYKGVLGYLFAALLLIFTGIYTMVYNLSGIYANFEYVLEAIAFIYLIAVPILTMRSLAEDKKQKTDQLLYSLPMRLSRVVMGKFLAMVCVLLLPVLIMAFYPLILSMFGTVVFSTAYSTLLAFFLLGASLLSIGLFISSVTENPVSAAVITLIVLLLLFFGSDLAAYLPTTAMASFIALAVLVLLFAVILFFLSRNLLMAVFTAILGLGVLFLFGQSDLSAFYGLFGRIVTKISLFDRFYPFVAGFFDLTAVVYYLSITGVFLFLSVQALEKRRWSE